MRVRVKVRVRVGVGVRVNVVMRVAAFQHSEAEAEDCALHLGHRKEPRDTSPVAESPGAHARTSVRCGRSGFCSRASASSSGRCAWTAASTLAVPIVATRPTRCHGRGSTASR